jgi:serine protease Do
MIRRPALAIILLAAALSLATGPALAQAAPSPRAALTYTLSSVVKKGRTRRGQRLSRRVVQARNLSPLFNDPSSSSSGNDFGGGVPQQRCRARWARGVILRADGLIVTNNHVIKNSDQITVVLSDRREYPAHVLLAMSASIWRC